MTEPERLLLEPFEYRAAMSEAIRDYVRSEINASLASMWAMILAESPPGAESQTVDEVAGRMLEHYGR